MSQVWFYLDEKKAIQGPFSLKKLERLYVGNILNKETLLWNGLDVKSWTPLLKIPRVYSQLNSAESLIPTWIKHKSVAQVLESRVVHPKYRPIKKLVPVTRFSDDRIGSIATESCAQTGDCEDSDPYNSTDSESADGSSATDVTDMKQHTIETVPRPLLYGEPDSYYSDPKKRKSTKRVYTSKSCSHRRTKKKTKEDSLKKVSAAFSRPRVRHYKKRVEKQSSDSVFPMELSPRKSWKKPTLAVPMKTINEEVSISSSMAASSASSPRSKLWTTSPSSERRRIYSGGNYDAGILDTGTAGISRLTMAEPQSGDERTAVILKALGLSTDKWDEWDSKCGEVTTSSLSSPTATDSKNTSPKAYITDLTLISGAGSDKSWRGGVLADVFTDNPPLASEFEREFEFYARELVRKKREMLQALDFLFGGFKRQLDQQKEVCKLEIERDSRQMKYLGLQTRLLGDYQSDADLADDLQSRLSSVFALRYGDSRTGIQRQSEAHLAEKRQVIARMEVIDLGQFAQRVYAKIEEIESAFRD